MMKTWLRRRPVRRPVSRATTAPNSSSVCRLPFIRTSASALTDQLHGPGRRRMAVRNVDHHGVLPRSIPCLLRHFLDPGSRPYEDRSDEPFRGGLERRDQRRLLARVRHRRRDRREVPAPHQQLFVLARSGFSIHGA